MLSLKSRFWWKKLLFFVSDLFLYFSVKLYLRLLFCGVYNFLMKNTHRKKKEMRVCNTQKKRKLKLLCMIRLSFSPVFLFLFPVRIRKVQLLQIKHVGVIVFLELFQKRKTPWISLQCTGFKKKKKKTFSYFTLKKLKVYFWIQPKTCPTDLKLQEQINMFIKGLRVSFYRVS